MAVSSEPLRSALVRSASLRSMRALPKPPSAVSFEPLRSALARPAPFSLIAPAPVNVASLKSPYDRCAPLRSSSLSVVPSVVSLHAIGQLLSLAARCLSISTVHGGAGGVGGESGGGEGGSEGGDSLQMSAASSTRWLVSAARSFARNALDGSVAMLRSVDSLTSVPKPHANTVTPSPLTSAAASTAVCNSVLPVAASTVCSPSEMNSMILVASSRPPPAKSCRAASKPSEIEVWPFAVIWSIPALITAVL
eukprot:scaffold12679_cov74-Phaeocystis_antarctica.AAC.1